MLIVIYYFDVDTEHKHLIQYIRKSILLFIDSFFLITILIVGEYYVI